MKKYEILYIIPSPFTEADAPAIQKNVNKILEEGGAKVINENNLGSKKLAYTIKNIKRGFYILTTFEASPESLANIEQKLKLAPEVLRSQITEALEYKMSDTKRPPRKARPASTGLSSLGGPAAHRKTEIKAEASPKEDLKTI
ncbi:MAG: 30S ribosomal protein S6, partial [Candidatus Parcubacteria bacterium]|nr:30S ribosomal protein S6 [Candidatus Parcubacteria bacterium]